MTSGTHALFCNDEAELKLGIQIALEEIVKLRRQEKQLPAKKVQFLEQLEEKLKKPATESVYICCFCEEDDKLSQWRAYGGNGNGVSIRLNAYDFESYTGEKAFGFLAIWNVFYNETQQRSLMRDTIEKVFQKFSKLPPAEIAKKAKDIIDFFVPIFKHGGFDGEKEWRMIFVPASTCSVKPRYRAVRELLVPYFSLKDLIASLKPPRTRRPKVDKNAWRLPVLEVRIGPSRHRELNRGSVQSLLSDSGYDVEVFASNTPYRS